MKDRIRQIMESQHMTQQVFAQYIGVSPAMLSSIYNGRTNPSLNIVEAIKKKIPNINTDWLLWGSGEMFAKESAAPTPSPEGGAAGQSVISPMLDFDGASPSVPQNPPQLSPQGVSYPNGVRSTRLETPHEEVKFIDKPLRRVIEIRVFYDDQTWDTFVPVKK